MIMEDPMHLEEITVYQQRFDAEKLFDGKNPEEFCREIIAVYDVAVKSGYTLSAKDAKIRTVAETIVQTIHRNQEVQRKYPDALERITKYQEAYRAATLFTNPAKELLVEISDVYLAARHLGYNETKEDREITLATHLILKPSILEDIIRRIKSDEIVDI